MRTLGIDPGTYNMGTGIVDSDGYGFVLAHSGVLTARKKDPISIRLHHLYTELLALIAEWNPTEIAVEQPFAARNIRTAISIGQAQSIAMLAAAHHKIPLSNYAPRQVKQSVTNYGGSSKDQVQEMVKTLLNFDSFPHSQDASDALAVAICHINSQSIYNLKIRE